MKSTAPIQKLILKVLRQRGERERERERERGKTEKDENKKTGKREEEDGNRDKRKEEASKNQYYKQRKYWFGTQFSAEILKSSRYSRYNPVQSKKLTDMFQ